MNRDGAPRKTLAEIISEKISEKRTEIDTQFSESVVSEESLASDESMAIGVGDVGPRVCGLVRWL